MADPGQLARDLIQQHFPKFGSIRKACTYRQMEEPVYDGNVTEAIKAEYPVMIIWDDFSFTQTIAGISKFDDSTILSIDRIVIFPALDLPVVPDMIDRIVDDSSVLWAFVGIAQDPADAHYEIHVRPLQK